MTVLLDIGVTAAILLGAFGSIVFFLWALEGFPRFWRNGVHKHDWAPLYHGGDARAGMIAYRAGEICNKCGVRRVD